MSRDMMKTVETIKGKNVIPDAYDINSEEMQTIYKLFHTDPYDAICTTFDYGFVLGARAQKAGRLPSKKNDASTSEEKKAYLDMINRAMNDCNDISLLDLIWKLLVKFESPAK